MPYRKPSIVVLSSALHFYHLIHMTTGQSVLRGTSIVGGLTLISRLLGFVRDLLVARFLGTGLYADAYVAAFRIPNLLRSIFAEGALTSAFVPVFSAEVARGKENAQRALAQIGGFLLVATLVISIIGVLGSQSVIGIFAPGFLAEPEKYELATLLLQLMFPYIIFVSVVALLNGALNTVKIFGSSAWAQVTMNLTLIAGALVAGFFDQRRGVIILALSVIAGGIVQVLSQVPALKRAGFQMRISTHLFAVPVRQVLMLMAPAILGATVYQLQIFLNTVLASYLPSGSVSWLFYADRVTQLPIGIFSIALASVLLPALSNAKVNNDEAQFAYNLMNALRYTSFVIIPVATCLFLFAEPLVRAMFERGAFTAYSTIKTSVAIQALSLGLWGASAHSMIVRAFAARKDTFTPTLIGIVTLVVTAVCSVAFMGKIQATPESTSTAVSMIVMLRNILVPLGLTLELGHAGLGLASGVASTLAMTIVALLLTRQVPGLPWELFIRSTSRALIASLITAAAVSPLLYFSPLVSLLGAFTLGPAVYIFVSFFLRSPEAKETFQTILRLGNRRPKL